MSGELSKETGPPLASRVFAIGQHCFQMDDRLGSVPERDLGGSCRIELVVGMNFLRTEVVPRKQSRWCQTVVRGWEV